MSQQQKYYPHIDGLRAWAVIFVILFHYKITCFAGGYSGVDIFFVISGYLITGILLRKVEARHFQVLSFYLQRFLRIFPALLCTVFFTCFIGAFLFSPKHLEHIGYSTLGSLGFFSNIVYWKSIGYFQILDNYDPFVPTWSLSIEMQYYLLFPLLFFFIYKLFKNNAKWVLFAGLLFSLAITEFFLTRSNNFVYYNLPFRFFEFTIGSLCVYFQNDIKCIPLKVQKLFPLSGSVLIVLALVSLDSNTPFPGMWALLPCIGAALIILGPTDSVCFFLFSNRVSQYLGKISYSLYLVHWPVYVIVSYVYFAPVPFWLKGMVFFINILLAGLMYNYVENAFRHQKLSWHKKGFLALATIGTIFLALSFIQFNGWEWRLNKVQNNLFQKIKSEDQDFRILFDKKFPTPDTDQFDTKIFSGYECSYNDLKGSVAILMPCLQYHLTQNGVSGYLVIGDSNAANVYQAFKIAFPDENFAMLQQPGCAAASYLEDRRSGKWCFKDLSQIIGDLKKEGIVRGVILASRWAEQPYPIIQDTLDIYDGLPLMILGPTPMLRHDTFETFFMLGLDDVKTTQFLAVREPYFHQSTLEAEKFLQSLDGALFVSRLDLLCPNQKCPLLINDHTSALFLDNQHLSKAGVYLLAKGLEENPKVSGFIK